MKRVQTAFTLVELLVVITVIGVLMGLLIPAVNMARKTARKSQCATNMKNFALAAIQHENSKGQFPGYVQDFGLHTSTVDPSDPSASGIPPHKKLGTWGVALLPWMDAQPTYEHWTQDRYPIITPAGTDFHPLAAPNLAIFQCPSDPVYKGKQARNSYIFNNGMCHVYTGVTSPSGITFENSQGRANGIGNSKYNVTSIAADGSGVHAAEGPKVRLDDLKDGQGFTMLVAENVQARPWHQPGFTSAGALQTADPTHTDVIFTDESARYVHGMVWHYEDLDAGEPAMAAAWNRNGTGSPVVPQSVGVYHKINGTGSAAADRLTVKKMTTLAEARNLARPSSAHVDGVNAAFADGATRFVRESIDYRVYQALLTPRGKSSNVPFTEFVITDELEN